MTNFTEEEEKEIYLKAGRNLARAPPGEEVVITGLAGRFPESDDCYQLRDNLYNMKDMVTLDDRRWDITKPGLPHRFGKINHIEKFDAGFFEIRHRHATSMDPQGRQQLERVTEAIFDAGHNLEDMKGSRTGVIVANLLTDSEKTFYYDNLIKDSGAITGSNRSNQAERISRTLRLKGPSFAIDTGSSSSLYALDLAYRSIRSGRCDNMIVATTNICLQPNVTIQLFLLGVLSPDGKCKCFDEAANGYVRSEAIGVIFLQKKKNARRIYAQVVHTKTNTDGYKEIGPTYPSGIMQKELMDELYCECDVDPSNIDYLEAHGTGTIAGDPEEVWALGKVFCTNRKTPLLVGSTKSNLGHAEGASGLCSIAKIILCMENDYISATLNYNKTKKGLKAIENGQLQVVTKTMPWSKNGSRLVAINSLGMGGANAHCLLEHYNKFKVNNGLPSDDIARLVCVSGRTQEAVNYILDDYGKRSLDQEFVRLLQEVFRFHINGHTHRGFSIVSKKGEINRSIRKFDEVKKPVGLFLGKIDSSWWCNLKKLRDILIFSDSFDKIHKILWTKNSDLLKIIEENVEAHSFKEYLKHIITQIIIIDMLKKLEVTFDYIISYSIGEIAAAYADDVLTLEEAVLVGYYVSLKVPILQKKLKSKLKVKAKEEQIKYNKDYELSGSEIDNGLLVQLNKIITTPKQFSKKWVNNVPTDNLHTSGKVAIYGTGEYFIKQIFNLNTSTISKIPFKSVIIKIGSEQINNLDITVINITSADSIDNTVPSLLSAIGEIYNAGYNPKIEKLYPEVKWPVSSRTPMISPLIKWNYSIDWFVPRFSIHKTKTAGEQIYKFMIKATHWNFMTGHVIDGRTLIPATAYLYMVWETFSMETGYPMFDMKIFFSDVSFHRVTTFTETSTIEMCILIQKLSGYFEIRDQNHLVINGRIELLDEQVDSDNSISHNTKNEEILLKTKDFYKELNLRGYNYTGDFQGVRECNLSITKAAVEWKNNWITFMDNMLQISILTNSERILCVPTKIQYVTIDPMIHLNYVKQFEDQPVLPVYLDKNSRSIKSGGIEIRGLLTTSITKRKSPYIPVLETYKFVPFEIDLPLVESIKVITQFVQENYNSNKLRIVEVFDENNILLAPCFKEIICDIPLIQSEIIVLSKQKINDIEVTVKAEALSSEKKTCSLVVVSKISKKLQLFKEALEAVTENGMILSRENSGFDEKQLITNIPNLELLYILQTEFEKLVLLKKAILFKNPTIIDIKNATENFDWLSDLQKAVKNQEKVIIVAHDEPTTGAIGLLNCIRCEPGGSGVKGVVLLDKAPKFCITDAFYIQQLRKGLAINIFKDGQWGTYRHLKLNTIQVTKTEHIINSITTKGDFGSCNWFEGNLNKESVLPTEKELVYIYWSALNFRDIMNASGRVRADARAKDPVKQYYVEGMEFSGITKSGRRVMGITNGSGIATILDAEIHCLWDVPKDLTLGEAATIPIAYATVFQALVITGNIQYGQSILIHVGSGAVGQAAINVAIYYNCNIFTTVGSEKKRKFIKQQFPAIPEHQIGNSRDTSFEQMVKKFTAGRGVDIVLNSLAEEKLQASLRCLAPSGHFLEIGKFDLISDHTMRMNMFTKGCKFSGVMFDRVFNNNPEVMFELSKLIKNGFAKGYVKPLSKTIFNIDEVENAYRYMAAAKHIGKVIIKIRNENESHKKLILYSGLPRFYCNSKKSYILNGGLGGFGVELCEWLISRGAKQLVIVTRRGVVNGYQASRISNWRTMYDTEVVISTADTTTLEGCVIAIKQANLMGSVDGIFNLAAILQDSLLENQTMEMFQTSLKPKAFSTQYFDKISRKLCPDLNYFVVFSSMVSGRGNAGQSNYGMGNSIMERICEERRKSGLPALAVQWGGVGDVGMVAETENSQIKTEIGGTLQQPISSCIAVLDLLFKQDLPIVSSMVVAERKTETSYSLVDSVRIIIGRKNLEGIALNTPFPQLGMDSIMAVEIRQTLERDYNLILSAEEIRKMTFASLQMLQ